jgi:hypothetical protein
VSKITNPIDGSAEECFFPGADEGAVMSLKLDPVDETIEGGAA